MTHPATIREPHEGRRIGFLATFEPTDETSQFMAFRIGYTVIGIGCVVDVGFLIVNRVRK